MCVNGGNHYQQGNPNQASGSHTYWISSNAQGVKQDSHQLVKRGSAESNTATTLVVARAVEDLDGVGKERCEGVERFDGAFGAAGKVEDEGNVADDGDASGQYSCGRLLGTFATHFLSEARNHFFGDVERGFRRVVAGAEAGAAGGEDEIDAA